jgi:hypothetical protein
MRSKAGSCENTKSMANKNVQRIGRDLETGEGQSSNDQSVYRSIAIAEFIINFVR